MRREAGGGRREEGEEAGVSDNKLAKGGREGGSVFVVLPFMGNRRSLTYLLT